MEIGNIEIEIPVKKIKLKEGIIEVKQFLPTIDKSDIFKEMEKFCFNSELIDRAKIDAIFNALVALKYTNLKYEYKEEEDLLRLYDYLEINGIMKAIISIIPKIEYDALISYFKNTISDFDRFKLSGTAALLQVMKLGPELMEKISEISEEIDFETIEFLSNISSEFI